MRLHTLEIEAFGPFSAPARIDFDTLSEAGLFLLSGPTGAGKTSVLDAVCFALYGDVPGDRSAAKRLRCDQASPDVAPRVRLEVTLGERRFRLERSPSWERPKRRGTGMTTQQASVTMSELRDGAWSPLSSRLDETGDLVGRLLGMNLAQFTQVAMLPQGRFQTFLRAKSEERHQLLQQLFRTGRFAEVERWMRDRRLELHRADVATHQRVADVVSRISEAAGETLPASWDVHDLRAVADGHDLTPWASELVSTAHTACDDARVRADETVRLEAEARAALDDAREESARRRRYDVARQERSALAERADAHEHEQRRLDDARRAAGVVPVLRHTRACAAAVADAERLSIAALRAVQQHLDLPAPPSSDEVADLAGSAEAAVADVRAVLPRVARRRQVRSEVLDLERQVVAVEDDLEQARAEQALLPARLELLRADVVDARAAAERLDALRATQDSLVTRIDAHESAVALRADLAVAREEWIGAREVCVQRKEALLVLQQARIDGMAAELAGALASGCSCPVCGSAEHPAKASAAPDAPDARAEKAARAAVDDADLLEHAFNAKVHELETNLAATLARAGAEPVDELRARLVETRGLLRSSTATAARLDDLARALTETEHAAQQVDVRLHDVATNHARLLAALEGAGAEVDALGAEIDAVLSGTDHRDLESLLAHHERTLTLVRSAARHLEQVESAEAARRDADASAAQAALEAHFADVGEAEAHALAPTEVEALARRVEEHRRRWETVSEVLAEDGAEAFADAPPPPIGDLEAAHRTQLVGRDAAAATMHVAGTRLERLTGLVADLDALLAEWAPLREDLRVATGLAGFVEGKSADNTLKMRLSAYVLSYRLTQVVAAANERLARMSDQRYSLEHTGQRGAGETRGGLSLLVRDDWSGERRDPATLSGGETFVVSLALALGLSDVVTHESGGAALDTLFVDEGFGSLDADTLDDVMDTLDALRDGGRVVGLVSHVAEMRDRIPTQLVVSKARGGSAVRLRGC